MSHSFFDTFHQRSQTASKKWDLYKNTNIEPFWVADMDFQTAPEIIAALQKRMEHGIFGYTNPPEELAPLIQKSLREHYGWEIEQEWIVWCQGILSGLNACCRAVAEPGDDILTPTPIYPQFLTITTSCP